MNICHIRVLHAASTIDKITIKIQDTSIPLHYKSNSEYLSFEATQMTIEIFETSTNKIIHTQNLLPIVSQSYTVVITELNLFMFDDHLFVPANEAKFRFINLSTIPSIDIFLKDTGDTTFKQLHSGVASEYLAVYPIKVDFILREPHTKQAFLELPTFRFPVHTAISFYIIGNKDTLDVLMLK